MVFYPSAALSSEVEYSARLSSFQAQHSKALYKWQGEKGSNSKLEVGIPPSTAIYLALTVSSLHHCPRETISP
jgi:hypothetical protein